MLHSALVFHTDFIWSWCPFSSCGWWDVKIKGLWWSLCCSHFDWLIFACLFWSLNVREMLRLWFCSLHRSWWLARRGRPKPHRGRLEKARPSFIQQYGVLGGVLVCVCLCIACLFCPLGIDTDTLCHYPDPLRHSGIDLLTFSSRRFWGCSCLCVSVYCMFILSFGDRQWHTVSLSWSTLTQSCWHILIHSDTIVLTQWHWPVDIQQYRVLGGVCVCAYCMFTLSSFGDRHWHTVWHVLVHSDAMALICWHIGIHHLTH